MNLFELQERLKDFSQDQLVREMQAPSGMAPQFLVLSELQRRQRMMAEEQAQMQTPQTTVAEDAIAAAGVPQGGLADMARAMAPQTDMDMNTAVRPVERMQEGGVMLPPRIEDQAEPMSREELAASRRDRLAQDALEEALAMMESSPAGAGRSAISRILQQMYPEGYASVSSMPEDEIMRAPRRMADGGVVRMQPGGLAGISRDIRDFAPRLPAEIAGVRREDFMLLSPEEQADIILAEDPTAGMRARGAEVYPEYDPQRTGQGFLIETLMPGRAAQIRASVAAAREAEAAAETEAADDEVVNLPEPVIDQEEDAGTPRLSFGDQFGDVDPAIVRRGGDEELTFGDIEPTDAQIPFALPRGTEEEEQPTAPIGGGAGAVAPATGDAFEQDKWLALAQAGLSLMSSQQPTIGGAIGEAGLAGLTALREAQARQQARTEREQARADRLAAAARADRDTYPYRQVDDLIGLADSFSTRVSEIVQANYGVVPKPGEPLYDAYEEALANANVYRTLAREAMGVE